MVFKEKQKFTVMAVQSVYKLPMLNILQGFKCNIFHIAILINCSFDIPSTDMFLNKIVTT